MCSYSPGFKIQLFLSYAFNETDMSSLSVRAEHLVCQRQVSALLFREVLYGQLPILVIRTVARFLDFVSAPVHFLTSHQ